ncbi:MULTISPECIES: tyrosine-type recombinase/integrase [Sphingobacterium]|uniref:tyrosine-type recombinase/integrase n=1 Tax=Sphingobacterium TaxID=28453 RepID=UPI002579571E|nr:MULTISPECIES: tyrosine-type recombinase/integrase [Sphingobacterium]
MAISKYTLPRAVNGEQIIFINKDGKTISSVKKGTKGKLGKGWVIGVSINGKQEKERITTKVPILDQEITCIARLEIIHDMLKQGLNPYDEGDKNKYAGVNEIIDTRITVKEAVDIYEKFLKDNRVTDDIPKIKKRLDFIVKKFENKLLENVTPIDMEAVIHSLVKDNIYADSTLKNVKSNYSTFFKHFIKKRIIFSNPMEDVSNIVSNKDTEDKNEPFSDEHFEKIMEAVKTHKKLYLFTSFMYHTCARPTELRNLKKQNIKDNFIQFKASTAKNKTKQTVDITEPLRKLITELNLDGADNDDYIFSNDCTKPDGETWGKKQLYINHFSNLFREGILKPLGLYIGTGYNLYSFKHTSNIHKLLDGWSQIELSVINRHKSQKSTESYIKKIAKYVKIQERVIREL